MIKEQNKEINKIWFSSPPPQISTFNIRDTLRNSSLVNTAIGSLSRYSRKKDNRSEIIGR